MPKINKAGYIGFNIPAWLHNKAEGYEASKRGQKLNGRTEHQGINHYLEMVSETIVSKVFGWKKQESYEWDLITPKGKKVDVKCRGVKSVPTKGYYEAGVHKYSDQDCDFYFFTRVDKEKRRCYLLGYMSKRDFIKKSHKVKSGSVGEDSGKKFEYEMKQIYLRDLKWSDKVYDKLNVIPYE